MGLQLLVSSSSKGWQQSDRLHNLMSSAKIYKYEICRYRQIFSTTIKNLLCLFVCIVNKTRFLGLIFLLPPQLSFLWNLLKLIVFYTSSKLTVFVINISLNHNLHKCCINPSLLYNLLYTTTVQQYSAHFFHCSVVTRCSNSQDILFLVIMHWNDAASGK